jgi:hypothetical protein
MALLLDAGALIGLDRGNRLVRAFLETAQRDQVPVRTTSAVVAQVWRDGARQASLARLLRGVDERPVDEQSSRRIGVLLGRSGSADVVDASLIDIALSGDELLTTDPADLQALARAAATMVTVIGIST